MQSFISAILGGLIVGALFLCFMPIGSDNLATVHGDLPAAAPDVETTREPSTDRGTAKVLVDRELSELLARVRKLETRANLPTSPATDRTILKGQSTPRLAARIRALEAQIEALRQSSPIALFQPDFADNPEHARAMISSALDLNERNQKGVLATLNRIPLRLWLLERWPKHPSVEGELWELVGDCCDTLQHHKAIDAIERFGPRAGLSNAQLDRMRLRAARSDLERVRISRRLVQSETNALSRALDMLYLAECLARTGRRDEALKTLDAALPVFENTPNEEYAAKQAQKIRLTTTR